jgi:site-specific DNA-methyltransferase (adenine-specific)
MINMMQGDCMELMARTPDKFYELAIVDPPYGIGIHLMNMGAEKNTDTFYDKKPWDTVAPTQKYFNELFRVSKNQIIWGGNYFNIPPSRGFVIWDKKIGDNDFSMAEYGWLSFNSSSKIFSCGGTHVVQGKRIHPTQKPVSLYKWLLSRYAKPGDKILDTHGGSGSICIACHDLGFDLDWIELDADYYEAACKRYAEHASQGTLFEPKELQRIDRQLEL